MTEPVLKAEGIIKRFGALVACHEISLDLLPGEIHALIGPNGAGKSTLVNQITGELRPDAGRIWFDGRDVSSLDAAARAGLGMARTFQISNLAMEMSVLKNVMLAIQAISGKTYRFFAPVNRDRSLIEPAMACLERVELGGRAHIRVADLSHGERRRLEIAVALALSPKAFLMDEPMAGMGPEGSRQLTAMLHELRAEAPILLIEHDMDAVFSLADRVSVLVGGAIIATGGIDEIRSNPDVQSAYLGAAT
jgi:branched-chain amino acid transport system ATP-binding protein